MSIIGLLIIAHCLDVSLSNNRVWGLMVSDSLVSRIGLIMWFNRRKWALRKNLPQSFWRWRWISIKLAMASIPDVEDMWNASKTHRAALHCIFLSSLRGYVSRALL